MKFGSKPRKEDADGWLGQVSDSDWIPDNLDIRKFANVKFPVYRPVELSDELFPVLYPSDGGHIYIGCSLIFCYFTQKKQTGYDIITETAMIYHDSAKYFKAGD